MRFRDEEAIDDGGVLKEFFLLIIREILNPVFGMFRVYPESRLLWFNESVSRRTLNYPHCVFVAFFCITHRWTQKAYSDSILVLFR